MNTTDSTREVVTRFEGNFNARDVALLLADMTEDAVFEHVGPADKVMGRFEGHDAIGAVFGSLEEHFPGFDLQVVDIIAEGDRCACQWTIDWDLPDGSKGHGAGTDVFTMRDGKICEKRTYLTL